MQNTQSERIGETDFIERRAGSAGRALLAALGATALLASAGAAQTESADHAEPRGPWRMLADPAEAGWSTEGLDDAHALAERIGSAAVMLVDDGVVIAAFGAVERRFDLHSVRKSVLATLFGPALDAGDVALDATLAELGIDDLAPLTDAEKAATVRHLLTSRSGVYLPAAKETPDAKRSRPARGSARPGERFHYNNWDFNVAGVVLERATGRGIDALFRETLGAPLGLQDLAPGWFAYELEPRQSRHPAYAFRLSARDLARFGALIANGGRVGERRVVSADWIDTMTTLESELDSGYGYGFMWWIYERGYLDAYPSLAERRVVAGLGTGGQVVAIVPDEGLVFVHRGDTDNGRNVDGGEVWRLFDRLLAARGEAPSEVEPRTVPMVARPLASVVPPPEVPDTIELAPDVIAATLGRYRSNAGPPAELFLHEGRLFVTVQGVFEGELHAASETELFTPHGDARVTVERDETGRATRFTVATGGRTMRYERAE